MSMYSTVSFVSNPLFFKASQVAMAKNRAVKQEIMKAETILSSKEGAPDYASTLDPGAYIQTEMNLKTYPKLQTIAQNYQDRYVIIKQQVSDVKDIALQAKTAMMQLTVTDQGVMNYELFISQMKSCLNSLTQVLNRTDGISTTLAGVGEDGKAVKDLAKLPQLESVNDISYDYYVGDEGNLILDIKGTEVNKFPVTASDDMFAKVIHACRICLQYAPEDGGRETVDRAQRLCEEAIRDFLSTSQKVDAQLGETNKLLEQIPADIISEEKKQSAISNQDQMIALLKQMELSSSLQIMRHLQTQNASMAKRFAESLGA